jgi:hypothetical protein
MAQAYPEPSMFGPTPAYGLWARHVEGLNLDNVRIETLTPDPSSARPAAAVRGCFKRLDLAWAPGAEPIVSEDAGGRPAPARRWTATDGGVR